MKLSKFIKKNNKLELKDEKEQILFKDFINKLKENEEVEGIFIISSKNITKGKLALIHHQISVLASEAGYSFNDMKKEVKRNSGLSIKYINEEGLEDEFFRSFSDCSTPEVDLILETCKELALFYNASL
jgi:hypothetical protein